MLCNNQYPKILRLLTDLCIPNIYAQEIFSLQSDVLKNTLPKNRSFYIQPFHTNCTCTVSVGEIQQFGVTFNQTYGRLLVIY